ncbi:MAG: UvrD-helicase domain-containing protein [Microbacter sp.]
MLHLYRASAGSGKTFRLTRHYLQMLFDDASSDAHRRILAVTFTNKATDEMKLRILKELHQLARGLESLFREDFMRLYHWSEQQVNQRAEQLLKEILHDYSFFAVSTIDRFFQQVLRNFAREMGLHGGYSIEIDTDEVLEKAINGMLVSLDEKEDRQLFQWLNRLAMHQIEQGKRWDLTFQLRRLSQELLKENFKKKLPLVKDRLTDKDFLAKYQETLFKITTEFETLVSNEAVRGLSIINHFGLSISDFKNKSRSPFLYLKKYAAKEIEKPTKSFSALFNNIEAWRTEQSPQLSSIELAYEAGLNDVVGTVLELFRDRYRAYATSKVILKQLFALGILTDIDKQIQLESEETHRLLITETSELLSGIIDGSDTPFVLEKIGVNLHHLLLDEFQDTSDLQWSNFKPLLMNSLSLNYDNLIVGDVKQSIYRWRNSNWELLDRQLFEDFRREQIQESFLNENWRSAFSIVHFNNVFFSLASAQLQDQINSFIGDDVENNDRLSRLSNKILYAYNNLKQSVPKNASVGNVTIQFYEGEETKNQTTVLSQIAEWIDKFLDMGYQPGDIAVLVRRNADAAVVVNHLLHDQNSDRKKLGYHFDVLSDEALVIGNATSVQLIILLLRYLLQPEEPIVRAKVAMTYFQVSGKANQADEVTAYFDPDPTQQNAFEAFEKNVLQCANEARNSSLFELTEALIQLLPADIVNDQSLFIQAFQDWVYYFSVSEPKGMDGFLSWWDEKGCEKMVPAPEISNAIRVMTVHKAKGLGFKVVLIPFTDWKLNQKETMLWCEPQVKPFSDLPIVPVSYSSMLQDTIFDVDYLEEKTAAMIDSLNVTYVAMTRAKEMLLVFAPVPSKSQNGIASLSSLLHHIVTAHHEAFASLSNNVVETVPLSWDEPNLRFTLGEIVPIEATHSEPTKTMNYFYHGLSAEKPLLSVKRQAKNVWELIENQGISSKLNYGILMHDVLRRLHSHEDAQRVMNDLEREGHVTEQEKKEIERMLSDFWSIPETAQWFDPALRSRNELPVLTPEGHSYVPDRVVFNDNHVVVVDYKFGAYHVSHRHQVITYKTLIEAMGYRVTAFLCYVPEKKVVQVFSSNEHEQLSLFSR